jgi:GNAT superfamily N-acetyltransferase
VLIHKDNPRVLGFYTLAATSIRLSNLPEAVFKKLPRYPDLPAIILGRLAVDQSQRGKGYGELLLIDAFKRCLDTEKIGWIAMVVDAKDEAAIKFYEHYHFTRFGPDSQRLFLLRKSIPSFQSK